jgi:S1-C subfamily serine protease
VRTGSLAHALGVRNGDQIVAANGKPIDSLDAAVALAGSLGTHDNWSLDINRRGKKLTLEYRLH